MSIHPGTKEAAPDLLLTKLTPGFAAVWHRYLSRNLGVRLDEPYGTIVWSGLTNVWRYARTGTTETQIYATDLALAMRRNSRLKLTIATGYYDLATPIMSAETAIAEAGAPLDRVRFKRYKSGHMVYFGGTERAFLSDVHALMREG